MRDVTLRDIVLVNIIPTAGVVFRSETVRQLPPWYGQMPVGDWPLHVLNAACGPIRYFDEVWGIYRIHEGGVWSSMPLVDRLRKNIALAEAFNRHLRFEHADLLEPRLAKWNYELALRLGDAGPRPEVLRSLLATLRYRHPKVPPAEVRRALFRYGFPWLYERVYWRWRRAAQRIRGRQR